MKSVRRFQGQLLYRTSYRPKRILRVRPVTNFAFRPARRFGVKPTLELIAE